MTKFYVTTPIYYINSTPSVGSAYTTIAADVLARWHRLRGDKVFFLTGLDENSTKTVQAARKAGYTDIKKYSDDMALKWIAVWKKLNISNDDFIRTTELRHKKTVQEMFMKIYKKGDIFKGNYEGLYCDGCETFYKEKDLDDGKCPFHKTKPKRISEENYFFKLSNYQKKLLVHLEKNPDFIQPKSRRAEVVSFVKQGLEDISISRPNLEWGIELPIDKKHRFWVWLDALANYISASNGNWPASLHLIGKDILRFHCILWPAFLMSAGYKLPKTIFPHGFFTVNGQKMSKSLGNIIDPLFLVKNFGVDSLRYYLMREIPFGGDGDFSEKGLITRHNNELANELGNLLNRVLALIEKNCNGKIPSATTDEHLAKKLNLGIIDSNMKKFQLHIALAEIMAFVKECNRFANDKAPWKLAGKQQQKVLYSLADSLRVIGILLEPFLPSTSKKILNSFNVKKVSMKECKFNQLSPGTQIVKNEVLFKKLETKTA